MFPGFAHRARKTKKCEKMKMQHQLLEGRECRKDATPVKREALRDPMRRCTGLRPLSPKTNSGGLPFDSVARD
jgi:hypothetical protein